MQQLVALCLVKDPTKRPTAARLLEHKFFKVTDITVRQSKAQQVSRQGANFICGFAFQGAHDANYLVKNLLADLPPLTERVKQLRAQKGPGGIVEKRQAIEKSNVSIVVHLPWWRLSLAHCSFC